MDIKCYSIRLLNPFRGTLNIIEYNSAEAVTMDGETWDIYVRNSALVKDLEQSQANNHRIQTSEIRFGRWTKKDGLRRGPIIDSDDFNEMAATGEIVYQYLTQHYLELPFRYQDNYELWLLDSNNQPLALLNSVVYQQDIGLEQTINWTSGIACRNTFTSNLHHQASNNNLNSAEQLNLLINSYSNNSAQWILKSADESAIGLDGINLAPELINRKFSKKSFPTNLLNIEIFNKFEQLLISDYLAWLAPWLLVLQCYTDEQRKDLEQQARLNALIIKKQYRLYPNIIDQKIIKSALVESIMRNNNEQVVEKVQSVEYLELNNPTHHLNK